MQTKSVRDSLDYLICALCLDYGRRERIIITRDAPHRVDNELRYLNFKIFDAVSEVVGEARADNFIREIGARIGYAKSRIDDYSESVYKSYKTLVKENIKKRLYLG
ncbi:MAG: hypothetical protein IKV16_03145 [Clostridia bacterium]|nr:hypothetical protein [Clostridia bacterium]